SECGASATSKDRVPPIQKSWLARLAADCNMFCNTNRSASGSSNCGTEDSTVGEWKMKKDAPSSHEKMQTSDTAKNLHNRQSERHCQLPRNRQCCALTMTLTLRRKKKRRQANFRADQVS